MKKSNTLSSRSSSVNRAGHTEFPKLSVLVNGFKVNPQTISVGAYDITQSIEISSSRNFAGGSIELNGSDIGQMVFDDGTEWVGYVGDFREIYKEHKSRAIDEDSGIWKIPHIVQDDANRSLIGKGVLKLLNIFNPKLKADAGSELAKKTDQKILKEGLFVVDDEFNMIKLNNNEVLQGKILLMLHGTLSSTKGSFADLQGETWKTLYDYYDYILAFEHHTLSVSPIHNTLTLLKELPPNLTLDILSHSRGGLIGDILARYDTRNDRDVFGFDTHEINLFGEEDDKLPEIINQINKLAIEKSLTVQHFVRVACPAAGTTLLAERLDHYLNAILNAVGFLIGGKTNILYSIAKEFLLEVVQSRSDAKSMPGLRAMTPDSVYQKINNKRDRDVKSKLFVIAGDSTIGGNVCNTLMVILTNLYYWEANDFVVDTKSMKRGVSRVGGLHQFLSKDKMISHFSYFNNDTTRKYILMGLQGVTTEGNYAFEYISKGNMDRGGLDLSLKMKKYAFNNIIGNRPIAILLPGIMGSLLNDDEGNIWVNLLRINRGDFVSELKIASTSIKADGVMENSYKRMGELLLEDNDLRVFAFDWRKSLEETAQLFIAELKEYLKYNQPINIVAHSMGGLVIKSLIKMDRDLWKKFCAGNNKLILLGTPWLGSHLIMEVLTGHSRRIKQLDLIDWNNNKKGILSTVNEFPGVFELLPVTQPQFGQKSFWANIQNYVKNMIEPSPVMLTKFQNYSKETRDIELGIEERNKVFYIAGRGETVNGYYLKKEFFRGEVLKYTTTNDGDGSVTYDLGIPKDILLTNLSFVNVVHGDLANHESVFQEVRSILKTGKLKVKSRSLDVNRDITPTFIINDKSEIILVGEETEVFNNLFDLPPEKNDLEVVKQELYVSIVNGDLKYANHPVMVGHFKGDGIYSAEKSLDKYLDYKLSERHKLGFYPADIGDSEVTFHKKSKPRGALVVGLGKLEHLTPFLLAKSVEIAVIKYSFFFRDNYDSEENKKAGSSLSTVIIGNSFGGISVEDSISAILMGVHRANRKINKLDIGLRTIEELEFVDYYEDITQQAYQALKNLEHSQNDINIVVKPYRTGIGSKKRISAYRGGSWWHVFNTTTLYSKHNKEKPLGLSFNSTSGKARVEQDVILSDLTMMEHLSKTLSKDPTWQQIVSKSLFELLIPNDFKSIMRNQNNILWKLDEYAAQFPWEMFHYYEEDVPNNEEIPTFVNTGLIRQLITDEYRINPIVVDKDTFLVVGDPDYSQSNISQLPSAAVEARLVGQILQENEFEGSVLINTKAEDIIVNMFSKTYKVMHFAAHGIYENIESDCENYTKSGIILGDGIVLEPGTINQLSAIPEFIFVNCCYSGTIGEEESKYVEYKTKLAANIGTQLIRMGVKAVVVTGWAVDDAAAHTFAKELYDGLFEGYEFGIAVQRARKKCFLLHRHTNTWGAYQCYGDYFYKLTNRNPDSQIDEAFVTSGQAIVELDNFLSSIKSKIVNVGTQIELLTQIQHKINSEKLENSEIFARYALINSELGKFSETKNIIENLLKGEKSDFSISLLERYHSSSGKVLLENYNLLANSGNAIDITVINQLEQSMQGILAEGKIILSLGTTSDRLSHIGNMYKRAALISIDPSSKIENVQQMAANFLNSYKISKQSASLVDQVFPLVNYLLAAYFLAGGKISNKELKPILGKHKSLNSLLDEYILILDKHYATFSDYYEFNAKSKILSACFVLNSASKSAYYSDFEVEMISSLTDYGNVKNIYGEIEHIQFLIAIIKDHNKKIKLEELKAKLLALLK